MNSKQSQPESFIGGASSELMLDFLFRHASDAVIVLNKTGHIRFVNSAFSQVLGWTDFEERKDFRSLVDSKDWSTYSKAFSECLEKKTEVKVNLKLISNSVGALPFRFVLSWLTDDLFVGVAKLRFYFGKDRPDEISYDRPSHETHEQKVRDEMERSLKKADVQISTILDRITDGFFVVDRNWKVLYLNGAAEIVARRPREEVIGKHLWKEYPELVGTTIYQKYNEAMVTGTPLVFEEYLPPLESWYETYLYPGPEGLSIYFHNITEKRTAQTKMQAAYDQLQLTTKNLQRSNEDLEKFAAVASHDLKEPLRFILLNLEILQKDLSEKIAESDLNRIAMATEAAKRNLALIDALLSYARATSTEAPFSLVDLNEICRIALTNLSSQHSDGNTKITVDKLPSINGNEIQLVQLFQNLLTNAIKFKSDKPLEIHIRAERQLTSWVICIEDNGIGMNSEHTSKIFNIFSRLPTQKDIPGTGIGLAIVKKIIQHHGGKIWVDSKAGDGSKFYCSFPKI